MTVKKLSALTFTLFLGLLLWARNAQADEWDQMTHLVFDQSVEVPGAVLPPGAYWFKIGPSTSDRNIVFIYSSDWKHLMAICETIPVERSKTTSRTELRLAERPSSSPQALLDWYYPGETEGHEFLYSRRTERELTRDAKLLIEAVPESGSAMRASTVHDTMTAGGQH